MGMIELLDIAPSARWVSGRAFVPNRDLPFGGPGNDNRGFALRRNNALCEDSARRDVLFTHPQWRPFGVVSGAFLIELPANALMRFSVGFLDGARSSDGVTFSVTVDTEVGSFPLWSLHKTYDEQWIDAEIDLSYWSGQRVALVLRAEAGRRATQDWAAWSDLVIEENEGLERPSQRWRFFPTSITVLDRTEGSGGGDDPFLATIYFRSVENRQGSTRVVLMDDLFKIAQNVGTGDTVAVPEAANLAVQDIITLRDNSINGIFVVAFEEDKRGESTIRSQLHDRADALRALLIENVENGLNFDGLVDGVDEILGAEEGASNFREELKDALKRAIRWLFRAHDLVDSNGIVLLGGPWAPLAGLINLTGVTVEQLEARDVVQEFAGDDGVWEITTAIRQMS